MSEFDRTGLRGLPADSYSSEYVELKTELRDLSGALKAESAKVLAKLESLEQRVRDIQRDLVRMDSQVQANRAAVASLKTAASVLGALAGMAVSFMSRLVVGRPGG